jgi:hypothetical protein
MANPKNKNIYVLTSEEATLCETLVNRYLRGMDDSGFADLGIDRALRLRNKLEQPGEPPVNMNVG